MFGSDRLRESTHMVDRTEGDALCTYRGEAEASLKREGEYRVIVRKSDLSATHNFLSMLSMSLSDWGDTYKHTDISCSVITSEVYHMT